MQDESTGIGAAVVAAVVVWVIAGSPIRDLKSWLGMLTYEDQLEALTEQVSGQKIGQTADYWLTKRNAFGQPDRVALVFGIWGDEEFCSEIAELYMSRYPADSYYCAPANTD